MNLKKNKTLCNFNNCAQNPPVNQQTNDSPGPALCLIPLFKRHTAPDQARRRVIENPGQKKSQQRAADMGNIVHAGALQSAVNQIENQKPTLAVVISSSRPRLAITTQSRPPTTPQMAPEAPADTVKGSAKACTVIEQTEAPTPHSR